MTLTDKMTPTSIIALAFCLASVLILDAKAVSFSDLNMTTTKAPVTKGLQTVTTTNTATLPPNASAPIPSMKFYIPQPKPIWFYRPIKANYSKPIASDKCATACETDHKCMQFMIADRECKCQNGKVQKDYKNVCEDVCPPKKVDKCEPIAATCSVTKCAADKVCEEYRLTSNECVNNEMHAVRIADGAWGCHRVTAAKCVNKPSKCRTECTNPLTSCQAVLHDVKCEIMHYGMAPLGGLITYCKKSFAICALKPEYKLVDSFNKGMCGDRCPPAEMVRPLQYESRTNESTRTVCVQYKHTGGDGDQGHKRAYVDGFYTESQFTCAEEAGVMEEGKLFPHFVTGEVKTDQFHIKKSPVFYRKAMREDYPDYLRGLARL